jgi:hypothetical protein
MASFLAEICGSIAFARSFPNAVTAIATDATSQRGTRLRSVAIGCFVVSAALLVAAAIVWSPIEPAPIADVLGWTGIVLLEAFLFAGNRCYQELQSID